jgi:hypothetical protein
LNKEEETMRVFNINGIASGYESLTTATAVGFTAAKILPTTGAFTGKRARAALISVEVADIRFTEDGTTPVVTGASEAGHLLYNGYSKYIVGEQNVANFKCINAVNASGAIVKCTYYF